MKVIDDHNFLATKLYIPTPRANFVSRPKLIERLNEGMNHKLTLISAPAGFGKTTLVSEWIVGCKCPIAWLSMDERDNDPIRFLTYLVAALQTVEAQIGADVLAVLKAAQPLPMELILTKLINEMTTIADNIILVLDDYHAIDSKPVDQALTFLLEHLPPQVHLVIATRENPNISLARLRVQNQLTELREKDLRFNNIDASSFLNRVMGLNLKDEDIAILEARTEGWIAGLQLAALSMKGYQDTNSFIKSFSGSHHFILDYLLEEVLQQQSENIQFFLLRTSVLERLCGSLCDAILEDETYFGQEMLEQLERLNLFIVPLDKERKWYRYHHLFADLLSQRLEQSCDSSHRNEGVNISELHIRASAWYEDNGLEIDAFHHAVAADDVERAERLIEGKGMPLHFRGALYPILHWLQSLSIKVLDANPSLWVTYASVAFGTGQTMGIEQKLHAAENALQKEFLDDKSRDLVGRVAAIRALLALSQHQLDNIIDQSNRALEYLHPDNLPFRNSTMCNLGYAYQLQGNRVAARKVYSEALEMSQLSGNTISFIMASIGMGVIQESDNQLHLAILSFQQTIQMVGDLPFPVVSEAYLGLGRLFYQWNDLELSKQYLQQGMKLAQQIINTDRFVAYQVLLARLSFSQGDVIGASAILAEADQSARLNNYALQIPEIVALQVQIMLHKGNLKAAVRLAQTFNLPISQARICLAQGDATEALAALEPQRQVVEAKDWRDERLKVIILQSIALYSKGEKSNAVQLLVEALTLAEPAGFIRIFIDEGRPMAELLSEVVKEGILTEYIGKLLSAFNGLPQPLFEPLSQREIEVLGLIAKGLSNREISERLFLALDTVKGHNRRIYDKLQVRRRTEALARAQELGLL